MFEISFAAPINLTMLDPFETYPHYTKHLIKVLCLLFLFHFFSWCCSFVQADHAIFIGSVAESSTPVVLVVEKLS